MPQPDGDNSWRLASPSPHGECSGIASLLRTVAQGAKGHKWRLQGLVSHPVSLLPFSTGEGTFQASLASSRGEMDSASCWKEWPSPSTNGHMQEERERPEVI